MARRPCPGEVTVWDIASGEVTLTLKGHGNQVRGVAFSPDGKLLASASSDQSVKMWDAASGKETLTLKGHTGVVHCVVFSPDGKRLASASEDRTVKVWDVGSGSESITLRGHSKGVLDVAFSPNGKRLVSASADQTVKVWNVVPISQAESTIVRKESVSKESDKRLDEVRRLAPSVLNSWTADQVKVQFEDARKGRYFPDPSLPGVMHLAWGGVLLSEQVSFFKGRCYYHNFEMLVSLDAGRRESVKLRTQLGRSREFQPTEIIDKKPGLRVIEADSWDVEGYRVYAFVLAKDELNPVTGERPSYTYGQVAIDMKAMARIEK